MTALDARLTAPAARSLTDAQRDRLSRCYGTHACARFLEEELGWHVHYSAYAHAPRPTIKHPDQAIGRLVDHILAPACFDAVYITDTFGPGYAAHSRRNNFITDAFSRHAQMWDLVKGRNMLTVNMQGATRTALEIVHTAAREQGHTRLPPLPSAISSEEYGTMDLPARMFAGSKIQDACYATLCALASPSERAKPRIRQTAYSPTRHNVPRPLQAYCGTA